MSYKTICIIGGGSIGGLLAYYAYRGGVQDIIVYYGSRESVEEIKRAGGLIVTYNNKNYYVPIEPRYYKAVNEKCFYVLNAVKTYQVINTIDLMRKITSSETSIVMFQNGFGSLELVEEKFASIPVAGAVVFIGVERLSRKHIKHHGGNTIIAGCRKGFCNELLVLQNILRKGGCDFRIVFDIDFYRWIKLAVNAVINPLTAVTRSKNKIVLTKTGMELAKNIINEIVKAARMKGYVLNPEHLYKIVIRGASNTANNYSSMAQDVIRGRKTEIDYINGYIARILGENSINYIITKIIHLIEESYMLR